MNQTILDAFSEVRQGFSADRVIADPELNQRFIDSCRRRGLTEAPVEINLGLLNLRKRGELFATTCRTTVRNQEPYVFGVEIAIRALERRHRTSLDRILCDPSLASQLDELAAEIVPGFLPLEYRWAALRLRKSSRLKPEIVARAVPATVFGPRVASDVDTTQIPAQQGVYILSTYNRVLYIGEAKNLRVRLRKHLEHSDNRHLARYIWECGESELLVEFHVLPEDTRTDVRRAMELELIRSRNPEFNIRR